MFRRRNSQQKAAVFLGLRPAAPTSRSIPVILLVVAWVCACAGPPNPTPKAPRLVLLYAACTVNADYLSPYSDEVGFTPRLADFASGAVVFERHMTESGQSGPAYASMFTGRHADGHGVFHHPTPIDPKVPILSQVFHDGGFHVEAWLAHVMASGELGFGRGADVVHDLALTDDTPEFRQMLERLRDDPDARALVIAQHTLTHAPYRIESLGPFCNRYPDECLLRAENPQRFDAAAGFYLNHHTELSRDLPDVVARFELRPAQLDYLAQVVAVLYRANVARLDHHFGTLLDAVEAHGLTDESVVAFTADHGETGYEPDVLFPWTHGHQLAPDVLRVPMILAAPGLSPRRYGAVTRSTDLLPTLASLAGLTPPRLPPPDRPGDPWNGVDLGPSLRGGFSPPELEAYSHTAMTAEVVLEESKSWTQFRRWFPREDPELMWTQLRRQDSVARLRGRLKDVGVVIEPDFSGPEFDDPPAALDRLDAYREHLVEAWRERSPDAAALDEERQKELLRRLGYIE